MDGEGSPARFLKHTNYTSAATYKDKTPKERPLFQLGTDPVSRRRERLPDAGYPYPRLLAYTDEKTGGGHACGVTKWATDQLS